MELPPTEGLGRDGEMPRLEDLGTTGVRATRLRPEIIIIDWKKNYREKDNPATLAHIAWLKESIRLEGVKKPIDVSYDDGKVYLESGYCRLTAAQQLRKEGWDGYIDGLPVKGDEASRIAKSLVDNTALPPTVLEFGKAAEQLLDGFHWDVERVAKLTPPHLGLKGKKAEQYVKQAVELQQAPMAVKDAVAHGVEVEGEQIAVSPALAVQATRKSREKAPEIIKAAVKKAKDSGKKTAKREKTAGKITKEKEAVATRARTLEKIGDELAKEVLKVTFDYDVCEDLAEEWQKKRVLQ